MKNTLATLSILLLLSSAAQALSFEPKIYRAKNDKDLSLVVGNVDSKGQQSFQVKDGRKLVLSFSLINNGQGLRAPGICSGAPNFDSVETMHQLTQAVCHGSNGERLGLYFTVNDQKALDGFGFLLQNRSLFGGYKTKDGAELKF